MRPRIPGILGRASQLPIESIGEAVFVPAGPGPAQSCAKKQSCTKDQQLDTEDLKIVLTAYGQAERLEPGNRHGEVGVRERPVNGDSLPVCIDRVEGQVTEPGD